MTTQNVYDDSNDTPRRDDPTGFAVWIEFDHSLNDDAMRTAATVFAEQLNEILTSKREPWGFGRAMVAIVLPATTGMNAQAEKTA